MLYSVVQKDYNGNGVIDGDDIAWVSDNNTSRVQNMPTSTASSRKRDYHGLQFVFNKRYSDRWQALASFLVLELRWSRPPLVPAGLQRRGPDVLGRQLDGHAQLHDQQPRWSAALHAQIRVQAVRLVHDSARWSSTSGLRFRMHTGRPLWQLENYACSHSSAARPEGVIDPGGVGQIVARRSEPELSADQTLLDLHLR